MSQEQYYLHRDGKGRFLIQNVETGMIDGLVFPASPGESAHAFSYDYGSVWYPNQLVNLADFPELAEMPFFTIESCASYDLNRYFKQTEFQTIWPLLGAFARFVGFSLDPDNSRSGIHHDTHPILWQYQVPNPKGSWTIPILDLWVNEQGCWFCTREGQVLVVNHDGEMIQQYALPKLTRCLTGWEEVPYVSCDDGNLYDLTAKLPQSVCVIRPTNDSRYSYQILALKQTAQGLLIADAYGHLRALDADWVLQWQHHQSEDWQGWFLQSQAGRVYYGHYRGVNAYDLATGELKWTHRLAAPVLCGCLTQQEVIVACSDRGIYGLQQTEDPKTRETQIRPIYACTGMPYAMTLAADQESFFVGDYTGKIERLDWEGNVQSSSQLQAGAVTALQVWGDRLYVATSQGRLMGLGVSG